MSDETYENAEKLGEVSENPEANLSLGDAADGHNPADEQMPAETRNSADEQMPMDQPEIFFEAPQIPVGFRRPVREEPKVPGSVVFDILFRPTLVYAVLFTLCMYDNGKGILAAVMALGTMIFCRVVEKDSGCTKKKGKLWYEILFVLLGLSCGLTDNTGIVFFNYVGMFGVLLLMLLHDYKDDSNWSFLRYLTEIIHVIEKSLDGFFSFFKDVKSDDNKDVTGKAEKRKTMGYVLTGLVVAVPLLVIVLVLLASADVVFANALKSIFQLESLPTLFGVGAMLLVAFFVTYAGMRYFVSQEEARVGNEKERYEPIIAITALVAVAVVYLIFSGIQIAYLFIGNLKLPDGYTYAKYAREGFFQLLIVCILNLAIVLVVRAMFREHPVLKVLLTVICGCTYIMIASSALRMIMYIQEYALTRKRVLVLWALVVIAVLFIGVVVQIFREKFPLFRYVLAVCAICYLVLSFGRMDYWIAKYDVAHAVQDIGESYDLNGTRRYGSESSLYYLAELSCDAAPAIDGHNGGWVDDYVEAIEDIKEDNLRQWNLSRFIAKKQYFPTR